MKRILGLSLALLLSFATAQTTIEFWYAFSDAPRSGWIDDRIDEFNAQLADQGLDYEVTGERKGSYRETLEAAALAARGLAPDLPAMKALGVPDLIRWQAGAADRQESVAAAKTASRRYAKRQMTWFRNRMKGGLILEAQYSQRLAPPAFAFVRRFVLTAPG